MNSIIILACVIAMVQGEGLVHGPVGHHGLGHHGLALHGGPVHHAPVVSTYTTAVKHAAPLLAHAYGGVPVAAPLAHHEGLLAAPAHHGFGHHGLLPHGGLVAPAHYGHSVYGSHLSPYGHHAGAPVVAKAVTHHTAVAAAPVHYGAHYGAHYLPAAAHHGYGPVGYAHAPLAGHYAHGLGHHGYAAAPYAGHHGLYASALHAPLGHGYGHPGLAYGHGHKAASKAAASSA